MEKEYLKLFKEGFDDTLAERMAVENYPFVGYDELTEELAFTIIPKPKVLQNNEVWYTTSDGEINPFNDQYCDATLVSNTYENGIGIAVFDKEITRIWSKYECVDDMSGYVDSFIGYRYIEGSEGDQGIGYSNLVSIILPNSIETVEEFALCYNPSNGLIFNPQSSLKEITFSNNVKVIKGNLFDLNKVYFKGSLDEYNSIEFLDNYYNSDRIDSEYLKHNPIVSGNANPANGAELIFV